MENREINDLEYWKEKFVRERLDHYDLQNKYNLKWIWGFMTGVILMWVVLGILL